MKTIFTLVIAMLSVTAFSQIKVDGKTVNVNGSHPGFEVSIPYGNKKMIEKELKNELKSWKGNYSGGDLIFVDDCKLKEMGKNTFDVYAKVMDIGEGGATVSIAIDLGGTYLSASEHSSQYKIIEARLYKFGVKAAKSVVAEDIKTEEKLLKEKEGELSNLKKEKEKKEKEIADYESKIKNNQEDIKANETSQGDKESEITAQKEKVSKAIKKKDAIK